MKSRFILGIAGLLAVLFFSSCPNQLMRDLVEQKLASPSADVFHINGGAAGTATQTVTLGSKVSKNNDSLEMHFKNETGDWSAWQPYSDSAGWTLTAGDNGSLGATKTVYAEFRDEGHHIVSLQDTIVYCAAVPNGNFFVWGTGTQAGQLHTQINTINSSLYISVADAVDMRFNNDGGPWSAWMPYSTSAAWPLQAIDGARTVNAEFRNAGGSNVLTPTYTINLDTIAPTFSAPLSINGAAAVSYSPSVSLTFTTPDGIWVEFQNDGGAWTAREAVASPRAWTLNAAAGSRTVGVRITDMAGNQTVGAPAGINLITSPPAPSTVSPTATLRPTWTWPAFSGAASYRMQMDSTAGAWTVIGGVTSYTPGSDLAVGMHTFYLQAQDSAGNWSTIGSSPVTIDLSAPGAPTLTVPSPTSDNTPTWSWLAVADAVAYLYQLDTTTGSWIEVSSSTLSFTPGGALSDGQHSLFLQARKSTGTLSPMASATTLVDTTPPPAPTSLDLLAEDDSGNSSTDNLTNRTSGLTFTGFAAGPSTIILYTGANPVGSCPVVATGAFTIDNVSLAQGSNLLTATATDAAGNVSPSSSALLVTVDTTAPSVVLSSSDPDLVVKVADAVTITATFSETAASPLITIGGLVTGAVMSGSGSGWTYSWLVPAGYVGVAAVSINATDMAGNPNIGATGAASYTVTDAAYVSTGGSPANSGYLPGASKNTLSDGIAAAQSAGLPAVKVAGGTYNISAGITMVNGISIYGAYAANFGSRSLATNDTILNDTRTSGDCVIISCTGVSSATVIDGFVIQRAATGSGSAAGIVCSSSQLTISNNTIRDGSGSGNCIGISLSASSPTIYNNVISGGSAAGEGHCLTLANGSNPVITTPWSSARVPPRIGLSSSGMMAPCAIPN